MCAWALGNIEARAGVTGLRISAQKDADPRVREMAVWAIAEVEDAESAEVLGAVLARDSDPRVRATAAWALGNIDTHKAPAGLITAVADTDDDIRIKSAWALGEIKDPAAVPALREALRRERNTQARRAQLRALVETGERSESMMTELLESSDPAVREAAIRGLAGRSVTNPWPWPQPRPRPFPR